MKRTIIRTTVFILLLAGCFGGTLLRSQNVSDLIISEVLALPDSTSIVDGYGNRNGWIELYNTSTGTVNMGGCYLTDDRNDLQKSLIPKNDLRTKLGPRQVTLFYTSGNAHQGTFYAGFKLRPGSTVYLVSNDGRTIVDSLQIPANLPAGKSVSKVPVDRKALRWEVDPGVEFPSPMVLNGSVGAETNAQRMAKNDPHGFILTIVSVTVVFSALAILWFLFWILFERPAKRKKKAEEAGKNAPAKLSDLPKGEKGQEIAIG